MQVIREIIKAKEFQIYALTQYGNLLFAYSPKIPVLSEQTLKILPISVSFNQLKKFCFQKLIINELCVCVK